jgi:hypothetical protein
MSEDMNPVEKKYIRNSAGQFVCPHCDKLTDKQNTMYYHIKKIHDKDLPFECKLCTTNPKFLQKSGYLHHMATIHSDSQSEEENPYAGISFSCPDCKHTTHTKANMIIHYARTHCKEWVPAFTKETPCTGCSKAFASSSAYLYHSLGCFETHAPNDYANKLSRIR